MYCFQMPYYLITPSLARPGPDFAEQIVKACVPFFCLGTVILQVRYKSLSVRAYRDWVMHLDAACTGLPVRFIVNTQLDMALALLRALPQRCVGMHLTSERLIHYKRRPLSAFYGLGASCHTACELQHAQKMGVDWVTLSPVCVQAHYANKTDLGWEKFAQYCLRVSVPVFALGGMQRHHLARVRAYGGMGIAGIRTFFSGKSIGIF